MTKLEQSPAGSSPRVGIVGGNGRMGKWFTRFFTDVGLDVTVSDVDTDITPADIARTCDIIILSLPMEIFPKVVRDIGMLVPEESLLTDFCSLKERQVECMLENSKCSVVGTHPLFGPGEDSIEGRRVAICPGRGKRWLAWWEGFFRHHGARTTIFPADEHDRSMAWVQALNHFILLCLGKALEEDGIDLNQVFELATPSFERQLHIVARLCFQDPELYATIQMSNPYTDTAIRTFSKYAQMLKDILNRRDRAAFVSMFREVQELGPYLLEHFEKEEKSRKR